MNCPVCNHPNLKRKKNLAYCPACQSIIRWEKDRIYAMDDGQEPIGLRLARAIQKIK